MRSILEIRIAVTEAEPNISDEELRLCVESLGGIEHFYRSALIDLIELIRGGKPEELLKMKAEFAWGTVERMFAAQKQTPQEWLGPGNIPGLPEQRQRLVYANRVYEKATGDSPPFVRDVVRQWMANEMSDISEETIFAGWEKGLEFSLWRAVEALPEPYEYCGTVIDAERIERLREVAEWLGEWMVWRDPDGITPVPLDVWKAELSVE